MIFFNILAIAAPLMALFLFPYIVAGPVGLAWLVGTIAGFLALGFGLAVLVEHLRTKELRAWSDDDSDGHNHNEKPGGFFKMLGAYLKSIKEKTCPIIEVRFQDDR